MEAKINTHRYYVEETKVDLLGLDDLAINVIEEALSVLLIKQNNDLKENKAMETRFNKVQEILNTLQNRKE
jgi:hypothetical protein|tara:strand:- start:490 stop:702 length:213 start_codon:yes stop_codon:yes gene_type:complete